MVRGRAAEALGNLGDTRSVEPLKSALNDENDYVHEVVEEALTKMDWQAHERRNLLGYSG
jgi:HEAT repeat protein